MRAFFDSNILVYRVDFRAPAKRAVACRLFDAALLENRAILSTQSLQEFYNAATRKLGMPEQQAKAVALRYGQAAIVQLTSSLVFAAMDRHASGQFSFRDALIVEAAIAGAAETLYSEDMQDGLSIGGLTIRNPFAGI